MDSCAASQSSVSEHPVVVDTLGSDSGRYTHSIDAIDPDPTPTLYTDSSIGGQASQRVPIPVQPVGYDDGSFCRCCCRFLQLAA